MKHVKPQQLSPSQRRDEIVDLLARAVVRLHHRAVLHKEPTPEFSLDLVGKMPLSVGDSTTTVDRPETPMETRK